MNSVIHLISGPRNISTALMYSFGNRKDTSIVDEPYYAHYLESHPEIDHPGRELIIESQESNFEKIKENLISQHSRSTYLFIKNMAHHLDGCDWSFIPEFKNLFLIRDPEQLITSFTKVIPDPTILDIGLKIEFELYQYLLQRKTIPVVIDSGEILKNPEKALRMLCYELKIPFSEKMLNWPAGPRKEDGIWAQYWYKSVHRSTSFTRQKAGNLIFPERLKPLLDEAKHYYDLLCAHSIKV